MAIEDGRKHNEKQMIEAIYETENSALSRPAVELKTLFSTNLSTWTSLPSLGHSCETKIYTQRFDPAALDKHFWYQASYRVTKNRIEKTAREVLRNLIVLQDWERELETCHVTITFVTSISKDNLSTKQSRRLCSYNKNRLTYQDKDK